METLRDTFAGMLETGDFSDLVLTCKGHEFKVHKALVCAHSPILRAAMLSCFREAKTNVYDIEGFEPAAVWAMVQFMYQGDYTDAYAGAARAEPKKGTYDSKEAAVGSDDEDNRLPARVPDGRAGVEDAGREAILGHIRANSIGDYFGLEKLVAHANEKMKRALDSWHAAERAEKSTHATRKGPDGNGAAATSTALVSSLPSMIKLAVECTGDKDVLDLLASAAVDNATVLLGDSAFNQLTVVSEFAAKMLHRINEAREKLLNDNQELVVANRGLKDQISAEVREHVITRDAILSEKDNLLDAINQLDVTSECRHCGKEFGCYVEVGGTCRLRCKRCRCRHP